MLIIALTVWPVLGLVTIAVFAAAWLFIGTVEPVPRAVTVTRQVLDAAGQARREAKRERDRRYYASAKGRANRDRKTHPPAQPPAGGVREPLATPCGRHRKPRPAATWTAVVSILLGRVFRACFRFAVAQRAIRRTVTS